MSGTAVAPMLGSIAVAAAAGLGFGLAYFAALRRTADSYAAGLSWKVPAGLTLGRIAAAVGFFSVAGRFGAMPLLAAFLGFLIARSVAARAAKGPA